MNTNFLILGAASSVVTLTITVILTALVRYMKRRIKVSSPESRKLDELIPLVNAIAKTVGPHNEALIALLEAQKEGKTNGNVDRALSQMRKTRDEFHGFLVSSALVEKEAS